jgi:two-component system, chemotaxis family, sensor kinase CheA
MAATGLDESRLRAAFLEEAEDLARKLGESLQALTEEPSDSELVNEVFRFTHSLKSESALMGYAVLSALAHRMEDVLGLAREGKLALDPAVLEGLVTGSDRVSDMMAAIGRGESDADFDTKPVLAVLASAAGSTIPAAPAASASATSAPLGAADAAPVTPAPGDRFPLGDAVRRRLEESRDRGEALYLLTVAVDESEDMKFPRAYLVFSNLEASANVVACDPALEGEMADDARYAHTTVLLTSAAGEAAVRAAASVDQVSVQSLEVLDYAALLAPRPRGPTAAAPGPGTDDPARKTGPVEKTTIRVDTRKLDDLWSLIAELVLRKSHIARLTDDLARGADPSTVHEGLSEAFDSLEKISGGMQEAMMSTRMIPISVIFSKFPRLVRDLSRKLGKSIELVLEGEETEIDRGVVEALSEPLTHIIRNSIDHGIEYPEERVRKGKGEKGRVTVSARRQGGMIVIEITDDGRGMDVEGIRRKAVGLGIKGAEGFSESELLDLVFLPGFSTKEVVTDLSGRGVGMDVVATRIRGDLKGDVALHTQPDRGTRISLLLPLTLTIVNALLVRGDSWLYAVPLTDIDSTARFLSTEMVREEGGTSAPWDGEQIPVHFIGGLLGSGKRMAEEYDAVVLRNGDRRAFLVVDQLLEEREVVIKPVDDLVNAHRLFAGVSILEDGRLVFILDTSFIRRVSYREGDAWAQRF